MYYFLGVINMNEIPRSYLRLFNAASDAIALIDEMNFGAAKEMLKTARSGRRSCTLRKCRGS